MDGFIVQTSILAALLILSAFFSGSETAFFSLNSLEKDQLRRRASGRNAGFVHMLFTQPDEVLVTVLTGNMFVNIFASSMAEALGSEIFRESAELVSIAAMTLLLLVVGEMTPKNLAIRHSLRFARFSGPILRVIHAALRPLTYPLSALRKSVLSAVPRKGREADADQAAAVLSAIRMGYQSKSIEEAELRLLERFFRFRQKTAADVMTPRVDLAPWDSTRAIAELISAFSARSDGALGSLVPVYKQDVDHLSGYVRKIDLLKYRFDPGTQRLSDIALQMHAVPASKDLRDLMAEMSELGTDMAVVVDEYGGTEGIVSFPGLVAYLFEDFLPEDERPLEQIEDDVYRVAGHVDVDEVAALLNIDLESPGRTIAGFVLDMLGEFPEVGAEITASGYVFRVTEVSEHRISRLEIVRQQS